MSGRMVGWQAEEDARRKRQEEADRKRAEAVRKREEDFRAGLTFYRDITVGERWIQVRPQADLPKARRLVNWGWKPPAGAVEGEWYCLPSLTLFSGRQGSDKDLKRLLDAEARQGVVRGDQEVAEAMKVTGLAFWKPPAKAGKRAARAAKAVAEPAKPAVATVAVVKPAGPLPAMLDNWALPAGKSTEWALPTARPAAVSEAELLEALRPIVERDGGELALASQATAEVIHLLVAEKRHVDLTVGAAWLGVRPLDGRWLGLVASSGGTVVAHPKEG